MVKVFLQVEFNDILAINKIEIYETFHAGGVVDVSIWNGTAYYSVYQAEPTDINSSRINTITPQV